MKKIYLVILLSLFLGCEAIFVEDISGDTVEILAPQSNTTISSGNIDFNWQLVSEADSYNIQIATPNFQNASQILTDSITSGIIYQKNLDAGEYEWRVKAMNSEYETEYSAASFTVN